MNFVLGDVKWLVENLYKIDKSTPIEVIVTDGKEFIKLEVIEVTMDKRLTIKCEIPPEVKDIKAGKKDVVPK